jgi:hypothetical protein
MKTRTFRKKQRRTYRGSANDPALNQRNCNWYWGLNKEFCKDDTPFINYPGLVNKKFGDVPTRKDDGKIVYKNPIKVDYRKRFDVWKALSSDKSNWQQLQKHMDDPDFKIWIQ